MSLRNMENLRPNDQRARNAINLIWIVLALEVMSLLSGYMQYDLLQKVADGYDISDEDANANDIREQVIAILYLIAYITSIVTFIKWFRRAYYNLHLKISYLSHREDWAVGSWFVPIVNLYRPYQIMKEIYQETRELLLKNGISLNQNLSNANLIFWWALWLLNNFVGQFVFRLGMKAESLDEMITSTLAYMIANIIGIPLALITIKVIKDYATNEPLLYKIVKDDDITPTEINS